MSSQLIFEDLTDDQKEVYYHIWNTEEYYYWLESIMTYKNIEISKSDNKKARLMEVFLMVQTCAQLLHGRNNIPALSIDDCIEIAIICYNEWREDEQNDII